MVKPLSIVALILLASCAQGLCGEIDDAARTGDLPKVKALLKENPALVSSPALDGWTPLDEAADNGYFAMVKVLVAHGADSTCGPKVAAHRYTWRQCMITRIL